MGNVPVAQLDRVLDSDSSGCRFEVRQKTQKLSLIKKLSFDFKSPYLSRIEGPPPKRNVAGSIPVGDAIKTLPKAFIYQGFRFFLYSPLIYFVWENQLIL